MTDTHANTRPVDRLFIGYNVLVAAGWLVAAARGGPGSAAVVGIAWAGAHVAALAVPFGARRLRTYSDRGALVAGLYPLVALPWFWGELGTLLPLVHGGAYDATVQRWDLALSVRTSTQHGWRGAMRSGSSARCMRHICPFTLCSASCH
jgi:hypothetical protein